MRTSLILAALSSLALRVSANCIYGTHFHRRAEDGQVPISEFGYSGTKGPVNWAGLSAENSACATSKVQSPIVLDDSVSFASEAPEVSIANVEEAEFENLGSTIEVVVNGTTKVAGTEFALKQFHLHTPSEHRINDEYFPLEMHMVHEAEDGSIAVIAVPFQLTEDGSTTELLSAVIENLGDIETPGTATKTGALDFTQLIDAIQTTPLFQYTGSLTTPPCAEGLTFLVVSEPLALNVATFNSIKRVVKFNARYSQNTLGDTNLLELSTNNVNVLNKVLVSSEVNSNVSCNAEPINNEAVSTTVHESTSTTPSSAHESTSASESTSAVAHEATSSESSSAAAHESTSSSESSSTESAASHESTSKPSHTFQTSTTVILTPEQACSRFGICSAKFGHSSKRGLFDWFGF